METFAISLHTNWGFQESVIIVQMIDDKNVKEASNLVEIKLTRIYLNNFKDYSFLLV